MIRMNLPMTLSQKIIENHLDPDSGLLDKLLGCGLITWDEFDDIRTRGSQRSKNEKLLNVILTRDLYQQFLDLLKETQQSHLADYDTDSDYYRRIVGGDIPLTTREETILDLNREVIIELINDLTEVVEQLCLHSVLTETQKRKIFSVGVHNGEMLVDMIRRRSLKDLQTTIRCLRDTRQSHLANILEGGVIGRVSCRIESTTELVNECAVVIGFLAQLNNSDYRMDGLESNLRLQRIGLSYVRRSNGVVLYFHFRSLEQLRAMRAEFNSGSLRQKAEEDFSELMTLAADKLKLIVDWPEYDYQRCELYFTRVSSTTVDDLPLEIMDMILARTVQLIVMPGKEVKVSTDIGQFLSVAQVCNCWSQRKSVLKKALHRSFTVKLQKEKKRSAILRNNRKYLVSELQPNVLIPQLVQCGCLDEKQATSLRRLQNDAFKNFELLRIVGTFSSQRHFLFVESLYMTNQLNAARIVERGGVTVKMCVRNETVPNLSELEKCRVGKLQTMLLENINDKEFWLHKLFTSVSMYIHDIVILNIKQSTGTVDLWLWCQSQDALDRLRDAKEGELIWIAEQMFNRIASSNPLNPKNACIDSSFFKVGVVVRPLSATDKGLLLFPIGRNSLEMFRISSLQDKIYTASDRTIRIYEYEQPYAKLEREINLPSSRMNNPLELAACQVYKCLYIVDRAESCIWKITPSDKENELKKWLSEPLPKFSVANDGKIFLIVNSNPDDPKLRIYSTDATLEMSVPLRSHSYIYTRAAVELMPDVVAVQYEKYESRNVLKGIAIMRLNESGDILREVVCNSIFLLAPFSAGRLIAADQDENKVMLLDDHLKPLEDILSKRNETRGQKWPQRFCYRKDTGELIVDHFGGSTGTNHYQVDVFKLSFNDECDA